MKDTLLAIETATSVCSVAVLRGAEIFSEVTENTSQRHSERLPELVDRVISEAGMQLTGLKYIVVSKGPGSFTGLRVGMAYAKGLCIATGAMLVTIPTLDALAHNILQLNINEIDQASSEGVAYICPMTIARKNESFVRMFIYKDGDLEPISDPFLVDVHSLEPEISSFNKASSLKSVTFCAGEGADHFVDQINQINGLQSIAGIQASGSSVGTLGAIAATGLSSKPVDLGSIEPLYFKEFTVRN